MENLVEYETLDEVHEAYVNWESAGKAFEFGRALWQTAEKSIPDESRTGFPGDLANEVFEFLRSAGSLAKCLTDDFRRLVIRYHAQGLPTTNAIEWILLDESMEHVTPFWVLRHSDVCRYENIKSFLVSRVSYLKPTHPRWPEKKFGDFWGSERAGYVDQIKNIPLTHPAEQLQKLSEHYADLETEYENAKRATDKERFHKCILRTLAAIYQISRDPSIKSQSHALTQENRTSALQQPKPEDIIDITPAAAANQES